MGEYILKSGSLVMTMGAIALGVDLDTYFMRHMNGDWGDLDSEDKALNDEAVKEGYRILSAYDTPKGRILIITEANRSTTTILLPSEN